jgi:hypothetical protein
VKPAWAHHLFQSDTRTDVAANRTLATYPTAVSGSLNSLGCPGREGAEGWMLGRGRKKLQLHCEGTSGTATKRRNTSLSGHGLGVQYSGRGTHALGTRRGPSGEGGTPTAGRRPFCGGGWARRQAHRTFAAAQTGAATGPGTQGMRQPQQRHAEPAAAGVARHTEESKEQHWWQGEGGRRSKAWGRGRGETG